MCLEQNQFHKCVFLTRVWDVSSLVKMVYFSAATHPEDTFIVVEQIERAKIAMG
jgi:hypothetical protein